MSGDVGAEVAAVLAAHGHVTGGCACGWPMTRDDFGRWTEAHRAHVADVLADLITKRVKAKAAEALREAAEESVWIEADEGEAFKFAVRRWLRDRAAAEARAVTARAEAALRVVESLHSEVRFQDFDIDRLRAALDPEATP